MNHEQLKRIGISAAGLVALGAALAWLKSPRAAAGIAAGGAWNLASLWCLVRLLNAWLVDRTPRRAVAWALVKFPVLYALAAGLLHSPAVSSVGFGIGLTIALLAAMGGFMASTLRTPLSPFHGR